MNKSFPKFTRSCTCFMEKLKRKKSSIFLMKLFKMNIHTSVAKFSNTNGEFLFIFLSFIDRSRRLHSLHVCFSDDLVIVPCNNIWSIPSCRNCNLLEYIYLSLCFIYTGQGWPDWGGFGGVTPPQSWKIFGFPSRKENFSCVLLEKIFTSPQCSMPRATPDTGIGRDNNISWKEKNG
jgi:hypothetical protein